MKPVALVTGAAKRLGRAIALRLAAEGHAVAVHHGRSVAQAEAVADLITRDGGTARVFGADLADPVAAAALLPAAAAALGPVTLLVNAAAVFEPDEALDPALLDRHFHVNLRAPLRLAAALARGLPEGVEGAVVNLTDQRVFRPVPGFFSYGLSKAALHAATTTLALALAPRVRVNAVAPGPTLPNPHEGAEGFAAECRGTPLRRGPTPEEIAEAVLYLARARSVTGETIAVDGGQRIGFG